MKRTYQPSKLVRKRRHGFRSKMKTKGGKSCSLEEDLKGEKTHCLMKSKIVSLKNNKEFISLLKGKKLQIDTQQFF